MLANRTRLKMGISLLLLAILFPMNGWTFEYDADPAPADMGLLMKLTARFMARVQRAQRPGEPPNTWECEHITNVPDSVRREMNLNRFYQKYLHAFGVPVISSNLAQDAALRRACYVVVFTLADRADIRRMFYKNHGRAAVISVREHVTTIPEHSWLPSWWNQRARGLGGTMHNPISTCGEENILCHSNDPWRREDIFLHEFVHGLHNVGVTSAIRDFDSRLAARYSYLKRTGLKWRNTYAMSTDREYLAEGAQSYFEDNEEQIPTNGIHNHVNTRAELLSYDRELYNFVNEIFPCKNKLLVRCDAINGVQPYHFKMNCDKQGNGILMDFKTKKPVGGGPDTPPPTAPPQTAPPQTTTQSPPVTTQPPPVTTQPPPVTTQPPPVTTQPPPVTTQPPPVTTQAPPPNTPPPDCKDNHHSCSYWARIGECSKNPGYMLQHCRRSCGVCCADKHQSCSYWARIGECSRNPAYMHVNCKKSCKRC